MVEKDRDDKDPRGERGSFGLMGGRTPGEFKRGETGRPPFVAGRSGRDSDRSAEDPWPERFRMFLDSCSRLLVDLIGEENVRSVFLCGSFAHNEGSVVFDEGNPLFLSDVDLVVVLESLEAHRRYYYRRNELGDACERLLPGARFLGHVEVAVLLPEDLERFPPRPGVFDMRAHAVVLHGDRDIISRIPAYGEGTIGGVEAVVLIENRIVPFLGSYPDDLRPAEDETYRFLYQISRTYTDIATSALCLAGLYSPGYLVRVGLLDENRENDLLSWLVPEELLLKVRMWTGFKIEPSLGMLDGEVSDQGSLSLWLETASDLLDFWRKAESHYQNSHADRSALPAPESLLHSRRRRGMRLENMIAWKAYLSPLSYWRKLILVTALKGRILSANPQEIVREFGVRLLDHRMRQGCERDVQRPPGGFPHGGMSWHSAVFDLHSLWVELVFGRKEY